MALRQQWELDNEDSPLRELTAAAEDGGAFIKREKAANSACHTFSAAAGRRRSGHHAVVISPRGVGPIRPSTASASIGALF